MKKLIFTIVLFLSTFIAQSQSLVSAISQSVSNYQYVEPLDFGTVLNSSISSEVDTQLLWKVYKASDFSYVTCDKDYFFTFSSDHDSSGGAYYGRCYWGKGNNLDFTDFEYLGITKEGLQAETPYLLEFPSQTNKLYFYYHVVFDRGISAEDEQETRAQYSTTGGLLHDNIWNDADPINILGEDLPQDHTGYLKVWNIDGVLKGTHYKRQSLPSFITGEVQVSSTTNGQDWTRENILEIDLDNILGGTPDRFVFPSYGEYFKYNGQWFWIGTDQAKTGSSLTSATRGLILCKSNTDLELTEMIMRLDNGVYAVESWHPNYLGDDFIHLYGTNINDGTTTYKRLDLRFLINYL